jgi:four helix bundle protein
MVRAANSIPANIAEGRRQNSEREFARFLNIALNSAYELEHHVTIAAAIGAITDADSSSSPAQPKFARCSTAS